MELGFSLEVDVNNFRFLDLDVAAIRKTRISKKYAPVFIVNDEIYSFCDLLRVGDSGAVLVQNSLGPNVQTILLHPDVSGPGHEW